MNPSPVLILQRQPSRQLAVLLCIMHVAALGLLWPLAISLWVKTMITAPLVISLDYYLRQDALLSSAAAVVAFTLTTDRKCIITTRSGAIISGNLLADTFVAPYLTVILCQPEGKWQSRSIVIMPDSLDAEAFRRLRVWLRWR